MTAADLTEIFTPSGFKIGLEEISSYLASIMQEDPIVHLLAKCLWRQKHLYALDRINKHDLAIWTPSHSTREKQINLEFKFNYETLESRLKKELEKLERTSDKNIRRLMEKGSGWDIVPRIWKDVWKKKPNLFVWIICSRDLAALDDSDIERYVNWWKPLRKYRLTHACKTDRNFLKPVDRFLEILQKELDFTVDTVEIETNGHFPSTYHFRICEFAAPKGSAGASPSRSRPGI